MTMRKVKTIEEWVLYLEQSSCKKDEFSIYFFKGSVESMFDFGYASDSDKLKDIQNHFKAFDIWRAQK